MNTFYYIVDRIDGDYAQLRRTQEDGTLLDEECKLVARALLPDAITDGTRLIYEWMQYRII